MKTEKWATEAQLLGWASNPRGQTITLLLPDEDSLAPFRALTLAKGKQAGQRLAVAFAVIGDDEKLVPTEIDPKVVEGERKPSKSHFPPGLTGLAVRWCADEEFQRWTEETFADEWREYLRANSGLPAPSVEVITKAVILATCGINSRKELDTDRAAAEVFNALIRHPYQKHLEAVTA